MHHIGGPCGRGWTQVENTRQAEGELYTLCLQTNLKHYIVHRCNDRWWRSEAQARCSQGERCLAEWSKNDSDWEYGGWMENPVRSTEKREEEDDKETEQGVESQTGLDGLVGQYDGRNCGAPIPLLWHRGCRSSNPPGASAFLSAVLLMLRHEGAPAHIYRTRWNSGLHRKGQRCRVCYYGHSIVPGKRTRLHSDK